VARYPHPCRNELRGLWGPCGTVSILPCAGRPCTTKQEQVICLLMPSRRPDELSEQHRAAAGGVCQKALTSGSVCTRQVYKKRVQPHQLHKSEGARRSASARSRSPAGDCVIFACC
jgi:hypothetical protein